MFLFQPAASAGLRDASLSASCLCGVARSLQLMPAATAVSMKSFLDERPTAVVCQSFACHASHVGLFVWVDPGKSRKGSFCSGVGLLFGLGLLGEAPQFSQWPAEAPHQRSDWMFLIPPPNVHGSAPPRLNTAMATPPPMIGYAPTSCATCKASKTKINEGDLRVSCSVSPPRHQKCRRTESSRPHPLTIVQL